MPPEEAAEGGPAPWPLLGSEPGPDLIVARARFDHVEHPRSGASFRRVVLEAPAWVNVAALTPARELVLIRQYRFGTRAVTLEIPGGIVEPDEAPLAAAQRELREESGYTAVRWRLLGTVEPNPAYQDNLCHLFLAEEALPTHPQTPDPGEDIAVSTLPPDEVRRLVHDGVIRHSLVICALARILDLRG